MYFFKCNLFLDNLIFMQLLLRAQGAFLIFSVENSRKPWYILVIFDE